MQGTIRPSARDFDPVVVGRLECDAWAAYYRREWWPFLRAAVGMVGAGFRMGRRRTLVGAWYVMRANQVWAPYPDNDPDAARALMRRFYSLVARSGHPQLDPARAAVLEVEWWRVHRMHQRSVGPGGDGVSHSDPARNGGLGLAAGAGPDGSDGPAGPAGAEVELTEYRLTDALVALYSYVYDVQPDTVRPAAELRTRAMDASDRWVAAGCDLEDPLLAEERRLLVASYSALRDAVDRS